MPNKRWNSMHGGNDKSGGGQSNKAPGSKSDASMPENTAAWPGLPGKGGPDRSGGTPKRGPLGPFRVKGEGI